MRSHESRLCRMMQHESTFHNHNCGYIMKTSHDLCGMFQGKGLIEITAGVYKYTRVP